MDAMLLLRTERLPESPEWIYELKLDGYRAVAIKSGGKVHLHSWNDNDFNSCYPNIVRALARMPQTRQFLDGEIVAFGADLLKVDHRDVRLSEVAKHLACTLAIIKKQDTSGFVGGMP